MDTVKRSLGLALVLGLAAAGCSHSPDKNRLGLIPPPPPPFLHGPMALLLTNAPGFSCYVVMTAGSPPNPHETLSGQLLVRDSRLLFAPDPKAPAAKHFARGGFGFIWDAAQNQGCLLSEALQGYAPVSSRTRVTNLLVRPAGPALETVQGHPCKRVEIETASDDGSSAQFRVWRATDLKGLPVRIVTAATRRPLTLVCSSFRLQAPASRLFAPPDGFARHESAEAMMAEMAMRQENLKRKPTEETPDFKAQTSPGGVSPR